MRLAPGGPFDEEQTLPPEIEANLQAAYGLDQPVLVQFGALPRRPGCAATSGRRSSTRTSRRGTDRARPAGHAHDRGARAGARRGARRAARAGGGAAAERLGWITP